MLWISGFMDFWILDWILVWIFLWFKGTRSSSMDYARQGSGVTRIWPRTLGPTFQVVEYGLCLARVQSDQDYGLGLKLWLYSVFRDSEPRMQGLCWIQDDEYG